MPSSNQRRSQFCIYAHVFGAEAALVRSQIFSGTHAIACALYGVLRPGDTLLAVSGAPYDTLEEVIGLRSPEAPDGESGAHDTDDRRDLLGTLADWHIGYQQIELAIDAAGAGGCPTSRFDLAAIDRALDADPSIRMLHVQRSCGYSWRPSIHVAEIERLCAHIERRAAKGNGTRPVVFVDNCYGVKKKEERRIRRNRRRRRRRRIRIRRRRRIILIIRRRSRRRRRRRRNTKKKKKETTQNNTNKKNKKHNTNNKKKKQ